VRVFLFVARLPKEKKMKTCLISFLTRPFYQVGIWLTLAVLAGLVTACSGAAYAPPPDQSEIAAGAVAEAPAPELARESDASIERIASPIDDILISVDRAQDSRVIIYTGNISLVVPDTREAMKAITNLAVEQGGYVSASNVYQAGEVPRGSITIRVPAESYLDTLEKLRMLAIRVEAENSGTEDVSEEYTDLQARKVNLEVTEKALQQLLEERQRVGSTSDILEVYRELTGVREQIEQIEGRLRYLANKAALSTITIDLIPDVLYQPVSVAGWEPQGVAKEAVQALVAALQLLANVLIWLIIFVAPLLIVFLIPVVLVIWLIRLWWKRHKARQGMVAKPPAATVAKAE
jgi:hypothetical protein